MRGCAPLLDWFVQICGKQVRKRGEILLDVDSTDDPTYGQQQLSFFNGGYDQHMYHPLLIFERHTGCRGPLELSPPPSQCFPPVVAQFRLQPCQPVSFAATFVAALRTNRNAAHSAVQDRARIRETARCIRIHLASGWPFQDLFQAVCNSS